MPADKPVSEWTHEEYVRKLVALDVIPAKVGAALMVLCEREKALAVNEALHRVVAPEGSAL